jgi:hypothetical protein
MTPFGCVAAETVIICRTEQRFNYKLYSDSKAAPEPRSTVDQRLAHQKSLIISLINDLLVAREAKQIPHGGSTLGNPRIRNRKHIFSAEAILKVDESNLRPQLFWSFRDVL